jgi:hypothetical protein
MKIAFAIHTFILALMGGVAWHAGGSLYLLTASLLLLLVYGLLGSRPGKLAYHSRPVVCAVVLSLSLLYYVDDSSVLWLCMLVLPHLLSALQCIWEIRTEGAAKDVNFIRRGQSMFTLGFYATMGLAFLLLRADLLNMERSTGMMLALAVSLPGLMAWEFTRAARLGKAKVANTSSGRGFLSRVVFSGLGLVMFSVLFTVALPLLSDALCSLSPKLNSSAGLPESDLPQLPASPQGKPDENSSNGGSTTDAGLQMEQSSLPTRGTLELSDEVHMLRHPDLEGKSRMSDAAQVRKFLACGITDPASPALCAHVCNNDV